MAKQLIMRKTQLDRNRFEPAYAQGEEMMESLRPGMYKITIKQSRNPEFLKLAFAFLNNVFKYQNFYTDKEALRNALSIDAGHIDYIEIREGLSCIKVRSWAFDEMDELEFHPLIARIVDCAIKRFDLPPDASWIPNIFVEDHDR